MEGIITRIRNKELPEHAMGAVVQGIMPLEPDDLVTAIYYICTQNPDLTSDAVSTFDSLPAGFKKTFFENKSLEAELIDFYLSHFHLPDEALAAALLNTTTMGQSILKVVKTVPASLLDLVVNNQVKIQDTPEIVEALRENPGLTINQKQKLDDYERLLLKDLVSPAEELEEKSIKEIEAEAIAEAAEFVQVFGKEKEAAKPKKIEVKPKAAATKVEPPPGEEQRGREKVSVLEQLTNMSVPQKVQAAIKGDREVRGILVRDANKMVCSAVIKSPRITDAEVEFYSNLRNVQTDVLRLICMNREWMRNYKIVSNLIHNPRTPLTYTMKLLPRLHKKDLRNLVRDKGIPEALRTMARRMNRPT